MSNSDQIIQSIASKQRQVGLWKNLLVVAILLLIGYTLYQGSADLQQGLLTHGQEALDNAGIDHKKIRLEMDGRSAVLSGKALDQESADKALAAVAEVPGIRSVDQRIEVATTAPKLPRAGTEPAPIKAAAAAPPAKSKDPIITSTETGVPHVRAVWAEGKLTLNGTLGSNAEMSQLLVAARNSYPPEQLDNQVRIQAGLPEASWLTSFTRHLAELKYQKQASMESSASQLLPKTPDQTRYVVPRTEAKKAPKPAANALALNTAANNAALPASAPITQPAPHKNTRGSVKKNKSTPAASTKPAATKTAAAADQPAKAQPAGPSLQLRSHQGRVSVSGVLPSLRDINKLSRALLIAYPPATTFNQVRIDPGSGHATWLDGVNKTWVLSQQIEWLDLVINNDAASLRGWVITDEVGKRIADSLAAHIQPVPVMNQLRSISSQQQSVAAAKMVNASFARGISFRDGQPDLSWAGHVTLGQIAKLLKHQTQVRLIIGVHSDAAGDARQNLYLSQKRAHAIKKRLIDLGIKEQNLMAIGYGASYPIADNNTPGGRALNRRIEFAPM